MTRPIERAVLGIALALSVAGCGRQTEPDVRNEAERDTLALIANAMGNLEKGSLEICEKKIATATDSLTYYDYYSLKARHFTLTDTPESTLVYNRRLTAFLDKQPQTKRISGMKSAAYANEAAYYYLMKNNPEKVIGLSTKAYGVAATSDIADRLPDLAANLADAYVAANDMVNAAKWYRRALFLVDSLGLPDNRDITLYLGLAQIYTNIQDFESAGKYYELTDKKYSLMRPNMQTYFLNNYGNYLYFKRDYEKALAVFMRMKRHIERYDNEKAFDMYLCKINLADVCLNLGRLDTAQAYLDEAEAYFAMNKVMQGVYYANTIRLGIATRRGDYATAERILSSGDDSIRVENSMRKIRKKYTGDYYVKRGDYKNAYLNMADMKRMGDSIMISNEHRRTLEVINRHAEDTLRLHYRLELEEKNAEVTAAETMIVAFVAIMIALAFVVAYCVIYIRKRRLKMHVDMMLLRMADSRQRMSPHFIFNLLNSKIDTDNSEESEWLMKISRLIKTNLDLIHRAYVTLDVEMDFVQRYIELRQTMMEGGVTLTVDIPTADEMKRVVVPSMFVQILVENALKHGLKCIEGEKRLSISVTIDDSLTTISVTDNGAGFDIRRYNADSTRSGLYIIKQTLNFVNHANRAADRMDFTIDNLTGDDGKTAGCRAVLKIPRPIKYPPANIDDKKR